ncbi:MAG TPA: thiamine phosphate synthase [Caulobacteraceae bacterium]|jgi:thiamine-phosphate pyrophosphorylase
MLLFTDPARTPDAAAIARRLPRGAGVVYRAFGAADAIEKGRTLASVCRRRGLILLVGADPALAIRLGADGVHLPERLAFRAGQIRALGRRFRITAAAHGLPAARRAATAGVEVVVLSPVFPSRSPSAGRPLGLFVLALIVQRAGAPVYALGGVNAHTGRRLKLTGAAGLAAVEALA